MDDRQWHLSKSVSLGHIITTMSVLTGVLWYFSTTDNRISMVEQDQKYLQATVNRVELQQKEQGQDLTKQIANLRIETSVNFQNVDRKLDKIIERELKK